MSIVTSEAGAVGSEHAMGDSELISAVARALWVWDTMDLELGEMAVVTGGSRESRLIALVATWYGPAQVLFVTGDASAAPAGVAAHPLLAGAEETGALSARLGERPGVAAAELSGRTDTIDALLESIPRFSRLMLAGDSREPVTIDYYNNVHRKGVRLVSAVLHNEDGFPGHAARAERARRLLARPARRQACLDALAWPRPASAASS
jgi:hypothetical protein